MRIWKASLFLVLVMAACLPAVAQTQIQLNIPFDFMAAGKSLPAGHYAVARVFDSDEVVWRISNQQGGMAVLLTNSVLSPGKPHQPSLVFNCTGTTCSLSQIWPEGHSGRNLPLREVVKTRVLTATSKPEPSKYVVIEAE